MSTELAPWKPQGTVIVPNSATTPEQIAGYALQLTDKQKTQVVKAFQSGDFEMGSLFLWSRSMAALKRMLSSLGTEFIGEMLDRPDIGRAAPLGMLITDFEAVKLAEELGMFAGTQAMRLRSAMELVLHYSQPPPNLGEDDGADEMTHEEGLLVLRACVQSVLGREQLDSALSFADFRTQLEERTFRVEDTEIAKLVSSPHFFKSTTTRVLMALVKTTHGAQLEHVLGNINTIVPALWTTLLKPDRWLVGRTYAELHSDGQRTAANGVMQALLKVRGFDFVPEDLRSRTFIQAAKAVEEAHNGMNNFYTEPMPMQALSGLGTLIPMPAFSQCMSATLSVRLGSVYGRSWDAQDAAILILDAVTPDRWLYYIEQCLPSDRAVLWKLQQDKPTARWLDDVFNMYNLASLRVSNREVKRLVEFCQKQDKTGIKLAARGLQGTLDAVPTTT